MLKLALLLLLCFFGYRLICGLRKTTSQPESREVADIDPARAVEAEFETQESTSQAPDDAGT